MTSLNATLYGIATSEEDRQQRRKRKVELSGRKAGVEVRRPSGEPTRRQEVVAQVGREPDVGAHVTARGGRVEEEEMGLQLHEGEDAAGRDDRRTRPPADEVDRQLAGVATLAG